MATREPSDPLVELERERRERLEAEEREHEASEAAVGGPLGAQEHHPFRRA